MTRMMLDIGLICVHMFSWASMYFTCFTLEKQAHYMKMAPFEGAISRLQILLSFLSCFAINAGCSSVSTGRRCAGRNPDSRLRSLHSPE